MHLQASTNAKVQWAPLNAERPLFIINLKQHLILPVFHLLKSLVLAIVQVLLTNTFSLLICENMYCDVTLLKMLIFHSSKDLHAKRPSTLSLDNNCYCKHC